MASGPRIDQSTHAHFVGDIIDPTTNRPINPGGGSQTLDETLALSTGEDIADALTGAASPDAGNVFATMADVGGGTATIEVVRTTIAFDTSNITTQAFPITDVDTGAEVIKVAGDHTLLFPAGRFLAVLGSDARDGTYAVLTSTFTDGKTVLSLDTVFNADFANGTIYNVGTAGVVLATLQPGDYYSEDVHVSVTTVWDGEPAQINFWSADPLNQGNVALINSFQLTASDSDFLSNLTWFDIAPNSTSGKLAYPVATDSIIGQITLADLASPSNAAQGEAEVLLVVYRA